MSTSKRPERRKSSLGGSSPVQPPAESRPTTTEAKETPGEAGKGQNAESAPTKKATPKAKGPAAAAVDGETVRLGIYMARETFDAAKSAYLSDWQHGGQADTFNRWIGQVIDAHAARGAHERARLTRSTERAESPSFSRSFSLPAATVERMRDAITADQDEGRWPSDSAWCSDAIVAAADRAREQAGGTLPQAPARLPNRLRR